MVLGAGGSDPSGDAAGTVATVYEMHARTLGGGRAEVDVIARRQDTPPKFVEITYELRVVTDEPENRVELLHTNLRRFGTVYNTLAAVCDVDGQVVAIPPAADAAPDGLR